MSLSEIAAEIGVHLRTVEHRFIRVGHENPPKGTEPNAQPRGQRRGR